MIFFFSCSLLFYIRALGVGLFMIFIGGGLGEFTK